MKERMDVPWFFLSRKNELPSSFPAHRIDDIGDASVAPIQAAIPGRSIKKQLKAWRSLLIPCLPSFPFIFVIDFMALSDRFEILPESVKLARDSD